MAFTFSSCLRRVGTATFQPSSQAPRICDALHACAFIRYLWYIRPILDFDHYRRGTRPKAAKESDFLIYSGGLMTD